MTPTRSPTALALLRDAFRPFDALRRAFAAYARRREAARAIRQLRHLSAHQLRDIGLTPDLIERAVLTGRPREDRAPPRR